MMSCLPLIDSTVHSDVGEAPSGYREAREAAEEFQGKITGGQSKGVSLLVYVGGGVMLGHVVVPLSYYCM